MFTLSAFADEISPDPQRADRRPEGVRRPPHRVPLDPQDQRPRPDRRAGRRVQDAPRPRGVQARRHRLADRQGPDRRAVRPAPGQVQPGDRAVQGVRHAEHPHLQLLPAGDNPFDGNWAPYRDEVMRPHAAEGRARGEGRACSCSTRTSTASTATRRSAWPTCSTTVNSPALKAALRPGELRLLRLRPDEGLGETKAHTAHFHIKDWKAGEEHGGIAGEGDGQHPAHHRRRGEGGYAGSRRWSRTCSAAGRPAA